MLPYPPIDAVEISRNGIPVAGMRDIAAMKIEAIAARGARRDFYDHHFICHDALPLERAMAAFEERFASAKPDVYHPARSRISTTPTRSQSRAFCAPRSGRR